MFVIPFSSKKFKIFLSIVLILAIGIGAGAVTLYQCKKEKSETNNIELMVNNSVSGIDEILKFISDFGWEVSEEPDDVREIIIPVEFDDVYQNYNEIQISQGYDLSEYAGMRVKKWCFTVNNYPGYENAEFIKINILVYNGAVIGGDVCSVKLDGFMHGFSVDDDVKR